MVVWVYCGGGDAEYNGIVPFLKSKLANCSFERRSPKPILKSNAGFVQFPGNTGLSLISEIENDILSNYDNSVDVILVIDDTDGENSDLRLEQIREKVAASVESVSSGATTTTIVGLAVPELEVWPLADWQVFETHFKSCNTIVLQKTLQDKYKFDFANLESFDVRPETGGYFKISSVLQEVVFEMCNGIRFSKAKDTPGLLMLIDPNKVGASCPHFKLFWKKLESLCV